MTYDFRTWQIDGKDSRSLVKLKEWVAGKFSIYQPDKNIYIRTDGQIGWCVQSSELEPDDYFIFEPTLLPYFFDEQLLRGFVMPMFDWGEARIFYYYGIVKDTINSPTETSEYHPDRLTADHALYTRMFQLLEERLTN